MMWDGFGGWAWVWMCLGMIVFWGLVAWVVVTLVRQGRRVGSDKRDADALLEERFARGEIDEDEYRRRREVIRH
jgi:putative membrane protein